jgi:hypothetical protein
MTLSSQFRYDHCINRETFLSMRLSAALILIVLSGCTPRRSDLEDEVREYVRLAVALGERDPDALDFYYGPADWVAGIRRTPPPLARIKQSAAAAIGRLTALENLREADRVRRQFLIGQLTAIETRVDLLSGHARSFDDESQAFFGIRPSVAADGSPAAARNKLAALLGGSGKLAGRYEAFDARFRIDPDKLPAVMTRALQACHEQTVAHMDLPAGESVTVEYVSDKPWSAYSTYQGNYHSLIRINRDFRLTVDRALQLACHEGYPGHHVFNLLTDENLVRKGRRLEFMVQPTFSPQSLLSEAAATIAPEIAFPDAERIRVERDALFPLAGLNRTDAERYVRVERLAKMLQPEELAIARDYLDGKLEFTRAADALQDRALMSHADATLRYLNEYRSYVITYTEGEDLMRNFLDTHAAKLQSQDGRWTPFRELTTNPYLFSER